MRVAKTFLEEHPEEQRKLGQVKSGEVSRVFVARFLGWDETRVRYSLERLGLIDEGIVEPEAERKLGGMLKETDRAKGSLKRGPVVPQEDHGEPTLSDLGLTKRESAEAQILAASGGEGEGL